MNVGIAMGNKQKILQTKLNHIRPLVSSEAKEVDEVD